jgi:hypothetical protein
MKAFVAAVALIGLASAHIPSRRHTHTPIVTVKNGTIAGIHKPNYGQDYFLGQLSSGSSHSTSPLIRLLYRHPLCAAATGAASIS